MNRTALVISQHAFSDAGTIAGIALTAFATSINEAGDWMLVLPAGKWRARDGRGPFDAGGTVELQAIVERSLAYLGETEMMVDYGHDQKGKAAGWVKELQARPNGVYARVEWTAAAREAIKAGEYRYLSPFITDQKGKIDRLLNFALVNMPALDLAATAAAALPQPKKEETAVDFMAKLRTALGLSADAAETAILEAVAANATRLAAAPPPDATALDALRQELTATATELAALKRATSESKATSLIDAAIAEGRVGVKPLRDHYIARAAASAEGFAQVTTELAALPALGGQSALPIEPRQPPARLTALSAEQAAVAKQLGQDPAKYLETLNKEREA